MLLTASMATNANRYISRAMTKVRTRKGRSRVSARSSGAGGFWNSGRSRTAITVAMNGRANSAPKISPIAR